MIVIKRCSITTLPVDIIVNAANPSGLGCFRPDHNCIDNVIHREAGPLLHEECKKIMKNIGTLGTNPIITKAYNLPSKNIMHVAGPQITGNLTICHMQQLSDCYTNCLTEAIKMKADTIAFPCISTGLYRFDNSIACDIAYDAVNSFFNHTGSKITVIFNVFTDYDEFLYNQKKLTF
jgi:O-acetyl-ADP-ribose deacetylase (regulator of RNase III)